MRAFIAVFMEKLACTEGRTWMTKALYLIPNADYTENMLSSFKSYRGMPTVSLGIDKLLTLNTTNKVGININRLKP